MDFIHLVKLPKKSVKSVYGMNIYSVLAQIQKQGKENQCYDNFYEMTTWLITQTKKKKEKLKEKKG